VTTSTTGVDQTCPSSTRQSTEWLEPARNSSTRISAGTSSTRLARQCAGSRCSVAAYAAAASSGVAHRRTKKLPVRWLGLTITGPPICSAAARASAALRTARQAAPVAAPSRSVSSCRMTVLLRIAVAAAVLGAGSPSRPHTCAHSETVCSSTLSTDSSRQPRAIPATTPQIASTPAENGSRSMTSNSSGSAV
jgi:hypothetical protein